MAVIVRTLGVNHDAAASRHGRSCGASIRIGLAQAATAALDEERALVVVHVRWLSGCHTIVHLTAATVLLDQTVLFSRWECHKGHEVQGADGAGPIKGLDPFDDLRNGKMLSADGDDELEADLEVSRFLAHDGAALLVAIPNDLADHVDAATTGVLCQDSAARSVQEGKRVEVAQSPFLAIGMDCIQLLLVHYLDMIDQIHQSGDSRLSTHCRGQSDAKSCGNFRVGLALGLGFVPRSLHVCGGVVLVDRPLDALECTKGIVQRLHVHTNGRLSHGGRSLRVLE
mmetsp:Transcript_26070/g.72749  ORF Transcript_26070/g.72749 Transcript_26070/m.72749 type:complete len:284 (+) Transcript_26070:517-1368(+)